MTTLLIQSTGRRKRSVARVRFLEADAETDTKAGIIVNGRTFDDFFPSATHREAITEPMRVTETETGFNIEVTLFGGGVSGQAGAMRHAIARALVELDPERRDTLKKAGFLTRDPRKKESKKYGLKKARKAPQYSKR